MNRPSYWQGCPSVYKSTCCTKPKGHTDRHGFLGERFWSDKDTNLPKTSAANTAGVCTGEWAGHTDTDDRHCVCWWDDRGPCCQCGEDAGVEPKPWSREELLPVSCISCGAPFDPATDPAPSTLGVRCANCWTGHRTSQLGRY